MEAGRTMKTVCELNKCDGCMGCLDICPQAAIKMMDELSAFNAVIDEKKCTGCGLCHRACQRNLQMETKSPVSWYQGWSNNEELRQTSSSGGAAAVLSHAFIEHGGIVCSCLFRDGRFGFGFAEKQKEIEKYAGSKYVKSDPTGIYQKIREKLEAGQKVLFIALPCQVGALKKYIFPGLYENLYTVDLICHGTPSPKLLERFLEQYGIMLSNCSEIAFREKAKFQIKSGKTNVITKGVCDRYSIAFLNRLIYTENCYSCQYARTERVSDITIGDSWGNHLPEEENRKGISLILCMTEKGKELLRMSEKRLSLQDVDLENAVAHNEQLRKPSARPGRREYFFRKIGDMGFNRAVTKCLPRQCFRQDVKKILICLHIRGVIRH